MLSIEGLHIEEAANWWADQVRNHLTEEHTDKRKQPRYSVGKGKSKKQFKFNTFLSKYQSIYFRRCSQKKYSKICFSEKNRIWLEIERFLSVKQNLIGDKNTLKDWIDYQQREIFKHPLNEVIQSMFIDIYTDVTARFAYQLLRKLGIRTCPYCNRSYTFAVDDTDDSKFKTRPEFDHFHNKSKYPFLSVTFYNLVPSCPTCNHGKGIKDAAINPYFDKFKSKFIIVKTKSDDSDIDEDKNPDESNSKKNNELNVNEILNGTEDFTVDFKWDEEIPEKTKKAEIKNINTFGLKALYNEHKDYVREIAEKATAYNTLAREGIVDSFQGLFHGEQEVYNLIFGKYLSDAQQLNRPLSKFTADILDQLEIG